MGDLNKVTKELFDAVQESNLEKVQQIIDQNGLSYSPSWLEGYVFLCKATQEKRTEVAKLLLRNGSRVNNEIDNTAMTPLHFAAMNGDAEVVEMLLDKRAHVNARTEDGRTPLIFAIKYDRETAARICLEHGADVNAKSVDNQTPLNLAVETSNLTIIREVLSYEPDSSDEYNRLALYSAIRKCEPNSEQIVADLLDYGLAISPQDITDGSLLYAAVKNGYEQILEDLLKYGADVNYSQTEIFSKTSIHASLLHIAAEEGRVSIMRLLLRYGADLNKTDNYGWTAICYAVANEHFDAITLLLDNGTPQEEDHYLALRLAVRTDNTQIVKTLLESNVDINAPNIHHNLFEFYGETALHCATNEKREEMVELFLDRIIDINSEPYDKVLPLHIAVHVGSKSITTMILNKGANINALGRRGVTALYVACHDKHDELVKILLEYGAESNKRGRNGELPLHIAAEKGDAKVVKILLSYNTDIDLKNDKGETALHVASQGEHVNIIDILLEHGSDINSMTKAKLTALDLATDTIDNLTTISYERDLAVINADYRIPKMRTVIDHLQQHMIKLAAANFYLNETNICSIDSDKFRQFRTDCENEIEIMKSEKISNDISFYDILTKAMNQLTAYVKNENVIHALTTNNYKLKFPIYASSINLQFKKGKERNNLLKPTIPFFSSFFHSSAKELHPCADEILNYLSNKDLRNLIIASKATNISYLPN